MPSCTSVSDGILLCYGEKKSDFSAQLQAFNPKGKPTMYYYAPWLWE